VYGCAGEVWWKVVRGRRRGTPRWMKRMVVG